MSNEALPTKKLSSNDIVEKRSLQIFQSKLPLEEALFQPYEDKMPNLDGHVEFLDESGSTGIRLFYQLKGTENDVNYYDCDIELINYAYRSYEPFFLILVNIPQEKVYWEHIDKAYVATRLDIEDLSRFDQKSKRIIFPEDQKINNNSSMLMDVCRKHYDGIAKILVEQQSLIIQEQEFDGSPSKSYEEIKEKFTDSIKKLEEKSMLYYIFVYILKPFFLDQRMEKKRREALRYLSITDSEERYIIENLITNNLLGRTGELIFVRSKNDVISVFNHFIDAGLINLKEITILFSKYD